MIQPQVRIQCQKRVTQNNHDGDVEVKYDMLQSYCLYINYSSWQNPPDDGDMKWLQLTEQHQNGHIEVSFMTFVSL